MLQLLLMFAVPQSPGSSPVAAAVVDQGPTNNVDDQLPSSADSSPVIAAAVDQESTSNVDDQLPSSTGSSPVTAAAVKQEPTGSTINNRQPKSADVKLELDEGGEIVDVRLAPSTTTEAEQSPSPGG